MMRAVEALRSVLPPTADFEYDADAGLVVVAGDSLCPVWIGNGELRDARSLLNDSEARPTQPSTVVAARRLSPGAKEALSAAGVGWVDETGAAEIATASILVSRPGQPSRARRSERWTPACLAVTEALLTGTAATVKETTKATGLSVGSCTNALRFLTNQGLLTSQAGRGAGSARAVQDQDALLDAYASAAAAATGGFSITVGAVWRDPVAELVEAGNMWEAAGIEWAATGVAAAAVMAPLLTAVTSVEVYVETATLAGLLAAGREVGLAPIEGGRLTLRTPPTVTTLGLANYVGGLRTAPWPRVFVDLRAAGVRGEEAGEHLKEIAGTHGS